MTDYSISHDPAGHRFSTVVDGVDAHLEYRLHGDVMTIMHTGVPEAIGGRGIAGALVKAAMDHARAEGLKVNPACSYSAVWMERHPDYQALRA
jgi:uncharacterized protein